MASRIVLCSCLIDVWGHPLRHRSINAAARQYHPELLIHPDPGPPEPTEEERRSRLIHKFTDFAFRPGRDPRKVFEALDEDHDGRISREQLHRAAFHIGSRLTDQEVDQLAATTHSDGDNDLVDYSSMLRRLESEDRRDHSGAWVGQPNSESIDSMTPTSRRRFRRAHPDQIDRIHLATPPASLPVPPLLAPFGTEESANADDSGLYPLFRRTRNRLDGRRRAEETSGARVDFRLHSELGRYPGGVLGYIGGRPPSPHLDRFGFRQRWAEGSGSELDADEAWFASREGPTARRRRRRPPSPPSSPRESDERVVEDKPIPPRAATPPAPPPSPPPPAAPPLPPSTAPSTPPSQRQRLTDQIERATGLRDREMQTAFVRQVAAQAASGVGSGVDPVELTKTFSHHGINLDRAGIAQVFDMLPAAGQRVDRSPETTRRRLGGVQQGQYTAGALRHTATPLRPVEERLAGKPSTRHLRRPEEQPMLPGPFLDDANLSPSMTAPDVGGSTNATAVGIRRPRALGENHPLSFVRMDDEDVSEEAEAAELGDKSRYVVLPPQTHVGEHGALGATQKDPWVGDKNPVEEESSRLDELRRHVRNMLPVQRGAAAAILRRSLRPVDGDNDGLVSYRELNSGLSALGACVSSEDMAALLHRFDPLCRRDGPGGGEEEEVSVERIDPRERNALVPGVRPKPHPALEYSGSISTEAIVRWITDTEGGYGDPNWDGTGAWRWLEGFAGDGVHRPSMVDHGLTSDAIGSAAWEATAGEATVVPGDVRRRGKTKKKRSGTEEDSLSRVDWTGHSWHWGEFRRAWEDRHGTAARKELAWDDERPVEGPTWSNAPGARRPFRVVIPTYRPPPPTPVKPQRDVVAEEESKQ